MKHIVPTENWNLWWFDSRFDWNAVRHLALLKIFFAQEDGWSRTKISTYRFIKKNVSRRKLSRRITVPSMKLSLKHDIRSSLRACMCSWISDKNLNGELKTDKLKIKALNSKTKMSILGPYKIDKSNKKDAILPDCQTCCALHFDSKFSCIQKYSKNRQSSEISAYLLQIYFSSFVIFTK